MMTRTQVAKRLGKSIATVRRMEGLELHPVIDARGYHMFREDEVAGLERHATRLPRAPAAAPAPSVHRAVLAKLHDRLRPVPQRIAPEPEQPVGAYYERRIAELFKPEDRTEHDAFMAESCARSARCSAESADREARAQLARDAEAAGAVRAEAVALIESLSARQLARLDQEDVAALMELLEG